MYDKKGYLKDEYRIFKLKDRESRQFDFHYHDFYKMILFESGNVTYCVEGKNYDLNPGDIVLVAANEIHKPVIDPSKDYERIVLYLSQSFLNEDGILADCFLKAKEEHTNVMRLSNVDHSKLIEIFEKAVSKEKSDEYADKLYSKLYVLEGLALINKSVHDNGLLFSGKVSYDRKIVEVCEYINGHLADDLSVDALSDKFYISKYYFMRKFKEYTGVTVHSYILEKRILYTDKLVKSGDKITTACLAAGFTDYSTYLRAAKRQNSRRVDAFDRE